jgi:uncharacterized lipoprotein YmbA
MRRTTFILIVAIVATLLAGCGSSSQTASQEVAQVKVSDKTTPAHKPAQFIKTAPESKKYPFTVTSVTDPAEAGKVMVTVTNVSAQPAGPLLINFGGNLGHEDVQPVQIETSDHQKLSSALKKSAGKGIVVKVLEPNASYTIKAYYPEGTCVQANAILLRQQDLTPFKYASNC